MSIFEVLRAVSDRLLGRAETQDQEPPVFAASWRESDVEKLVVLSETTAETRRSML